MTTDVAKLKEEGNALFVKKDLVAAYEKYTEAIALDDYNAVLYANRAACNFSMNKYLDAVRDAHKATEIDPAYAKGWSRLATAHEAIHEWSKAVNAWQKALEALPNSKAELSPAEAKQKEQYTASLQKAKQRLEEPSPLPGIIGSTNSQTEKWPWQVAEEILPELTNNPDSSAWVIYYANREFVEGVEYMKKLKEVDVKDPSGRCALIGHTGAITSISNGLMSDIRVFRLDCADWMDMYNRQLMFEIQKYEAWASDGVDDIQRSALERLKKAGWDAVRPALATVVRGWIMRAIFDCRIRKVPHVAVERLKQTLELLHWGRQVWKDVHKDNRGAIFQETFVRGVKVQYINALMEAHGCPNGGNKETFLATLFEVANDLCRETPLKSNALNGNEPLEPGFISAFYIYPNAEAHAMLGYYHVQMARSSQSGPQKKNHYMLATGEYIQAARLLPNDDERHCWYLSCAVDPSIKADAPKDTAIRLIDTVRESMPLMKRIWAHSTFAKQGRDAMIEMTLRVAEQKLK